MHEHLRRTESFSSRAAMHEHLRRTESFSSQADMHEHLRRTESFSSSDSQDSRTGRLVSPNPYGELPVKTLSRMFYETAERLLSETNEESDTSSVSDVSESRLNLDDFTISNAHSSLWSVEMSLGLQPRSSDSDGWRSLTLPQTYREDAGQMISQIASLSGEHGASIFQVTDAELAEMREPVAIMRSAAASCLDRLGLCYQLDYACDFVSSYTIDFALVSPGCDPERVAILVDGPSHKPCFLRVRDRLLRARRWSLVRLSLSEWSRLSDQKNEDLYLSRRLKGLSRGLVHISPRHCSPVCRSPRIDCDGTASFDSLQSTASGMSASSTDWSTVTTAPLLADEPSVDPIAGCKRPWDESNADEVDESNLVVGCRRRLESTADRWQCEVAGGFEN